MTYFVFFLFFRHSVWEACSLPLIPDTHISSPSHRPSTSRYSASYVCPLVEHTPHWVPCRWLAGDSQVIPIPYFIRSSVLRSYSLILRLISILSVFLYSLLILYQIYQVMSRLYSFYFIFFPCPMSHFSVPHLIIPYFFQMSSPQGCPATYPGALASWFGVFLCAF